MQQENLVKKYFWDFAATLVNSFLAKSLGVVGGQESYFLFCRLHIYFDLCRQISLGDWEGYYSARGRVKFPSKGEYTTDDTDFNSSQRNNY